MELSYPPPHTVLYECLNDKSTELFINSYVEKHKEFIEVDYVDAAVLNSIEEFSNWFSQWISFMPAHRSTRVRILVIWHAHFLSLACQQMLRRSLEQRSFRCRVFFHIEENTLQPAIISRCIVRKMKPAELPTIHVNKKIDRSIWETEPKNIKTDKDKK
jgi:DNA polymerase III delta prime subunit